MVVPMEMRESPAMAMAMDVPRQCRDIAAHGSIQRVGCPFRLVPVPAEPVIMTEFAVMLMRGACMAVRVRPGARSPQLGERGERDPGAKADQGEARSNVDHRAELPGKRHSARPGGEADQQRRADMADTRLSRS